MARRTCVALLVAVGTAAVGCDKRNLTEVEVPDEGVSLQYDLTAGKVYAGHIRVSSAVGTPVGDVYNAIEYDVTATMGDPDGARSLVRAKITNIKVDSRLPDGIPAQLGLSMKAAADVEGMEVRFFVDGTGHVTDQPEAPADAPLELQAIIGLVGSGLKGGFARLPAQPVKQGESWDTAAGEEDPAVQSKGTGTLVGLARDDKSGEDMARLEYEGESTQTREVQGQSLQIATKATAKALFSRTGYASKIERRLATETNGMTNTIEIDAEWTAPSGG